MFFACAPCIWEDVGICKSDFAIRVPVGFDLAFIVDTFQPIPLISQNMLEPTQVHCMILFAVCLLGSGGPNARGLAEDFQIHPYSCLVNRRGFCLL